jgi:hypothetical protein
MTKLVLMGPIRANGTRCKIFLGFGISRGRPFDSEGTYHLRFLALSEFCCTEYWTLSAAVVPLVPLSRSNIDPAGVVAPSPQLATEKRSSITAEKSCSDERDEAIKRRAAGEALADIAKSYGVPLRRRRIPQRIAERSEGRAGFAYAFDQLK